MLLWLTRKEAVGSLQLNSAPKKRGLLHLPALRGGDGDSPALTDDRLYEAKEQRRGAYEGNQTKAPELAQRDGIRQTLRPRIGLIRPLKLCNRTLWIQWL